MSDVVLVCVDFMCKVNDDWLYILWPSMYHCI